MTMRPLMTLLASVALAACGGSSPPAIGSCPSGTAGTTPAFTGPNVVDVVVDSGPAAIAVRGGYTNGLFATVTLCVPGTTDCQTIDHLLVDTGSVGVRVLESLVTLALPSATSSSGQALAACGPFVDGNTWGPLKKADVLIGQESAFGLTVQLIGASTFPVASTCTGIAITDLDTLGTNGILGVGIYAQDCGANCALGPHAGGNPGVYYACAAGGCAVSAVPTSDQVGNPVASFPVDNNGVIIALPGIADPLGAPAVPGQLVFGIGTQANNDLGGAALVALDRFGFSTTSFPAGGSAYASIIDSGSNGLFFLDQATTGLAPCTGNLKDFYCPPSMRCLDAALLGPTGSAARVDFGVVNPAALHGDAYAFNDLAGPIPANPSPLQFDWGLPFFFGRTVFTAIEGRSTPAGPGPYIAF